MKQTKNAIKTEVVWLWAESHSSTAHLECKQVCPSLSLVVRTILLPLFFSLFPPPLKNETPNRKTNHSARQKAKTYSNMTLHDTFSHLFTLCVWAVSGKIIDLEKTIERIIPDFDIRCILFRKWSSLSPSVGFSSSKERRKRRLINLVFDNITEKTGSEKSNETN